MDSIDLKIGILIPFILAFIIAFTVYVGNLPFGDFLESPFSSTEDNTEENEEKIDEKNIQKQTNGSTIKESTKTKSTTEPKTSPTQINTFITDGPKEGEKIEDINKVTFKFEGKILNQTSQTGIFFETKLQGIDNTWKKTYSKERTITLPTAAKEYTFLVRAKTNNYTDSTLI